MLESFNLRAEIRRALQEIIFCGATQRAPMFSALSTDVLIKTLSFPFANMSFFESVTFKKKKNTVFRVLLCM